MAERWQQWMPFHIDRFRGSLHVQGMPGCARAGYLYLLASAWQSSDCSLPNEDFELQVLSGLTQKEWTQYKPVILRRFAIVDGCLVNEVLRAEWNEAHRKYETNKEARSEAGKIGAARRWNGKPMAIAIEGDGKPIAKNGNNTGTETGTTTKPKSKATTGANAPFVLPDWVDCASWNGYEDMRKKIRKPMTDYARELCIKKLSSLKRAGHDPTDVLEQSAMEGWQGLFPPKGEKNDGFKGKTESSLDALAQARAFNREQGSHHGSFGEVGRETAGEVITPGLPHPGRGLTAV